MNVAAADPIRGSCHCGAVQFTAKLTDGLRSARRCTCSYCRMRGGIAVSAELDGINITRGAELISVYQFNTKSARHYFCSRCGIYTHHQRRSNPNQYGVNVACLDGVSPFDFQEVPVYDGTRHPRDGYPLMQAGTLIFKAVRSGKSGRWIEDGVRTRMGSEVVHAAQEVIGVLVHLVCPVSRQDCRPAGGDLVRVVTDPEEL